MNKNKQFFKGLIYGVIIVLAINIFINAANVLFDFITGAELSPQKKMAEIKNVIDKYFVGDVDEKTINEGIYAGMLASLQDRYSYYMDKETFNNFLQNTEGTYTGIGITINIDKKNHQIIIVSCFEGSSGEKAGLRPGDIITAVNNTVISDSNYEDVASMLKGAEGTNVKLSIFRKSDNSNYTFDVKRENVDIPTVDYEMLEDSIGYIRISKFDRVTFNQYSNALNSLQKKGMERLIIDLRNNPGGLLDTVVKITDTLVPKGTITYIENKNGEKSYEYSSDEYLNKPLVIIVNSHSASASEVLSGAVKDFGTGKLVGTKTFGKGVVQNVYKLSDGSGVKVTIAKYYTPKGICIHGKGIEPDFAIDDKNAETEDFVPSDLKHEDDIQLQKAIEVIKGL